MKPMGPIPPGFIANPAGHLMIGGRSADELVTEAGGTPLIVYDSGMVERQIDRFRAAMFAEMALHYAIKANPYEPLLEAIAKSVDGFDVASEGELERVAGLGRPISFAGPGKRDGELHQAIAAGALIELESEAELDRVRIASNSLGIPARVAVRVNPDFAVRGAGMRLGGGPQQFGIDCERVPEVLAPTAAIPSGVAALTQEILGVMARGKLMKTAAVVILLACAGFGMVLQAGQEKADAPA